MEELKLDEHNKSCIAYHNACFWGENFFKDSSKVSMETVEELTAKMRKIIKKYENN